MPVPHFLSQLKRWIVDISQFGDMTFYDPSGKSPCTYIDEDDARAQIRMLLKDRQPILGTVKKGGVSHQLSQEAIENLAADGGDSIMELIPQLLLLR
jgi:hypothetical protein